MVIERLVKTITQKTILQLVTRVLKANVTRIQLAAGRARALMTVRVVDQLPLLLLTNAQLQLHLAGRTLRRAHRVRENRLEMKVIKHSNSGNHAVKVGVVRWTGETRGVGKSHLLLEQRVPVNRREEGVTLDPLSTRYQRCEESTRPARCIPDVYASSSLHSTTAVGRAPEDGESASAHPWTRCECAARWRCS